jgi:hypothetical protein
MEDEYTNVKDEDEYTFIMYKIIPKNQELNYCYIGHTVNFSNRKNQHIRNTSNENDHKHYHLKHYDVIRQTGGWDEWEMIEIEQFKGKTKLEARIREQQLIEEYGANLNSLKAYITEDERKATKNAITEKYREENKEKIRQQEKKYKEDHKEIIAEQMKKYRAENKDKINEKTREYRENNKEKHQEWQRIWREKNKEILKEKRKLYDAKKKQEKLEQMALSGSLINKLTPEEEQLKKEQHKKEKRDQYNAARNEARRLKRLQEKQNSEQNHKLDQQIIEKIEQI